MCQKELVQLQDNHDQFAKRSVRIVAISDDDQKTAQITQKDLPDLVVVSDPDHQIAKAMAVIDPRGVNPNGGETNAPTTFLVDGQGYVRRIYRAESFLRRLSPAELLRMIDQTWPSAAPGRRALSSR